VARGVVRVSDTTLYRFSKGQIRIPSIVGLTGIALGPLIGASVLLAFDLFAERRGARCLAAIANRERSG